MSYQQPPPNPGGYGPPGQPNYNSANPGYGAPGSFAPPGSSGAPQYGAPNQGYGAPGGSFAPPGSSGANYAQPPVPGAPAGGYYGAPGAGVGSGGPSYGAPPSYGGAAAPPGAAPTSMAAPKPLGGGVTFFSTSGGGGAPVTTGGPPSSGGGMHPPPSNGAFGPPSGMGGPPPPQSSGGGGFGGMMPPPPSSNSLSMPPPPPSGMQNAQFYSPASGGGGNQQQQQGQGQPGQGAAFGPPPGQPDYGGQSLYGALPAAGSNGNMMAAMPSAFDSGPMYPSTGNFQGQQQQQPGAPGQAVQQPGAIDAAPLPTLDEIDFSIQCNPAFMQSTVKKLLGSQNAANATKLPLGLVCKPMAGDKGINNDAVEVVDFGTTGIVRCKRCRTYINPFVSWVDNGRRWRCNICGMLNDVPSSYFSHLDNNGRRRDRDQRPELCRSSVEFIAPGDYMVRPPQPSVYFFVIDVSAVSAQSGMLQWCVDAIKGSLDELPGNPRTQIGFITFDTAIHFYNLKSKLASPQMLVVSDVTDVIMPLPEDLLVNLQDSRAVVDSLLDSLPTMFSAAKTTAVNTCTGPALMAAKRVIQQVGGKLCLFQSSLPSIGEGTLKPRDNPRLLGTDKEHMLLNAEDPWYKNNAIDFSRLQVAIDTFLFSSQYTDLATLSILSKYTSGNTYYYPSFYGPRDGVKFEKELRRCLTRATAFEAVMRVRATRGMRITNFYGNYFVRGTDLLALPNCTADSTFALELGYDESVLSAQVITVQAALLYTNSNGERRIRVHTMVLPVTQSIPEVLESADIDCMVNILAKQSVDIAQKTGFDNARQRVHQVTVDILRAAKNPNALMNNAGGGMGNVPGYGAQYPGQFQQPNFQQPDQPIPASLQLLPLYSMSLQKSLVLRGGQEVRTDERAYYQQLLQNMDVDESKVFIYPRMFSIHDMSSDVGIPSDSGEEDGPTAGPFRVRLPAILNLCHERLSSDGLYLMENGYDLFMWIGRAVNPAIIDTLFGVPSVEVVDPTTLTIQAESSDFSNRVNAIIVALRQDRARHMHLNFIREGDGLAEVYFSRYLVEDRANFPGGALSYTEYFSHVTRQVSGIPG